MKNQYQTLFGLAKELGLSKETISDGAAQWTGVASLKSLSKSQLKSYEMKLRRMRTSLTERRRAQVAEVFERNGTLSQQQFVFITDLVAAVFNGDIAKFRAWLKEFFVLDSERFIDKFTVRKVIKALQAMRARGFKTDI